MLIFHGSCGARKFREDHGLPPLGKLATIVKTTMIATLTFGRTGHENTRTIFGAAVLAPVTQDEADQTLDLLLRYRGQSHRCRRVLRRR